MCIKVPNKDHTLEELDEMKIACRKFSSYKCVGTQEARNAAVAQSLGWTKNELLFKKTRWLKRQEVQIKLNRFVSK